MSFLVWLISPSSLKCLIIMVNWIFDNHNIKLIARLKHMIMKPLKKFLMRPIWISFRGQTSRILKTWIDRICLNTFGIVLNNFSWFSRERNPRRIGSGRIQIDRDREREPAHQERDFRAIRDRFDREDRRFDNRDNRNYGRREFEDRVRICNLYY